jgi:lipid-binding SYLF domain-containing protein
MQIFLRTLFPVTVCLALLVASAAASDPDQTLRSADDILHEIMVIPAWQIPEALLSEAQGVAIIPDVIKIGFVAGIRRGHGVVMVRDANGQWTLPQFITLTGGSVGWQAGVQGTDVVLVFLTKKSVEGLLRGKFTVGADAAVAAGPVGRNAAAATDVRLKAEILSYSRSRGLFVGLALDGSAIEIDPESQMAYFGSPAGQLPMRVPEPALKLRQDLIQLTPAAHAEGVPTEAAVPTPATKLSTLRQTLAKHATALNGEVDASWKKYLALPQEVFEGNNPPRAESLQAALAQYDRVAGAPKYKALVERPEFQSTYELLREYTRVLSEAPRPQVSLPPPPVR